MLYVPAAFAAACDEDTSPAWYARWTAHFDRSVRTIREWRQFVKDGSAVVEADAADPPQKSPHGIPVSPMPRADLYPELHGDHALISDIHLPFHDADVLGAFLDTAGQLGITRFAIVGDTWDNAMFHKRSAGKQADYKWEDTLGLADQIFAVFAKAFPDGGDILQGNHCQWLFDRLGNHASPQTLLARLFSGHKNVRWHQTQTARLRQNGQTITLTHGRNYSQGNPLGVAKRLCSKTLSHVVMGHQHHNEAGRDVSGHFQAVCMGGAHDPRRQHYIVDVLATNPTQTTGFAMARGGIVTLFDGAGRPV